MKKERGQFAFRSTRQSTSHAKQARESDMVYLAEGAATPSLNASIPASAMWQLWLGALHPREAGRDVLSSARSLPLVRRDNLAAARSDISLVCGYSLDSRGLL